MNQKIYKVLALAGKLPYREFKKLRKKKTIIEKLLSQSYCLVREVHIKPDRVYKILYRIEGKLFPNTKPITAAEIHSNTDFKANRWTFISCDYYFVNLLIVFNNDRIISDIDCLFSIIDEKINYRQTYYWWHSKKKYLKISANAALFEKGMPVNIFVETKEEFLNIIEDKRKFIDNPDSFWISIRCPICETKYKANKSHFRCDNCNSLLENP